MNAIALDTAHLVPHSSQRSASFYAIHWTRVFTCLRGLMPAVPPGRVMAITSGIANRLPSWVQQLVGDRPQGTEATRLAIDRVIALLPPVFGAPQAVATEPEELLALLRSHVLGPNAHVDEAAGERDATPANPETAIRAAGLRFVAALSRALLNSSIGLPAQRPAAVLTASAALYEHASTYHPSLQQSDQVRDRATALHATIVMLQALFISLLEASSPPDLSPEAVDGLWRKAQVDFSHAAGAAATACTDLV